jgi:antitoxin VapB
MPLNIKNQEVETLASQVASLADETKTEAIRQALIERLTRLRARGHGKVRQKRLRDYLERNVWPLVPSGQLGRALNRDEEDQILGYSPKGY